MIRPVSMGPVPIEARVSWLLVLTLIAAGTSLAEPQSVVHLSRFGAGSGPTALDGTLRLLDSDRSLGQSNAIAYDRAQAGAFETVRFSCRLRILEGGDGGAIAFLSTREYGLNGPAPFVASWVEPNLRGTFAVGLDVHNPPNDEPFGPWGNYQSLPEREVSLHWDGREIIKRVAPAEFRGDFAECEVIVRHGIGGAEVTVRLGPELVYDGYFIPGLLPYESRLALGAGTRLDVSTEFDVEAVRFEGVEPAFSRRPPVHFELFNHVLTDNAKTAFETEVVLPPMDWAFARVILTLEIHDAGPNWDEWDRCGELSVRDSDGNKRGIVPFITSYRTPCHWQVDVTHFRPYLAGRVRFEIAAGTNFYKNRGYMMSAALDFHHGTPELEPYRVVSLWHGTAHYGSSENHFQDFFDSRSVMIDDEVARARLFVTTTGHSQVGEFTPSKRSVLVTADAPFESRRFSNTLWKSDVYLNPNRPQFGTWKYSRAGWAPGDIVWPWWIELEDSLPSGTESRFAYEPAPYEFADPKQTPEPGEINAASHNVRAYLILYRVPRTLIPAPILRVTEVAEGSAAAAAGVQAGDYLAEYEGARLESIADLRAAIESAREAEKDRVLLIVVRGSEKIALEAAAGRLGVGLAQ